MHVCVVPCGVCAAPCHRALLSLAGAASPPSLARTTIDLQHELHPAFCGAVRSPTEAPPPARGLSSSSRTHLVPPPAGPASTIASTLLDLRLPVLVDILACTPHMYRGRWPHVDAALVVCHAPVQHSTSASRQKPARTSARRTHRAPRRSGGRGRQRTAPPVLCCDVACLVLSSMSPPNGPGTLSESNPCLAWPEAAHHATATLSRPTSSARNAAVEFALRLRAHTRCMLGASQGVKRHVL